MCNDAHGPAARSLARGRWLEAPAAGTLGRVPELPEVEALAAYLRERAVGRAIARVDVASIPSLKTYDPTPMALHGSEVTGASRHGKFLDLDVDGIHLVVHLARAGWLHYREQLPAAPLRPGKGPIALRVRLDDDSGFDLTEAGTKKGLAIYLVRDPSEVPGVARLGPDALAVGFAEFAERVRGQRGQIKGVLTDQSVLAGVGNAYSDEILHAARLSPFALAPRLSDGELEALYEAMGEILRGAVARSVGQGSATLKGEKRSGLRVHAKTGLPCPVCGDTIREVSFAEKSLQYCATCQTGGKPLADRRMSKLLR
ncbi:MAG: formamidopyrimidine-DNA glycosylase [Cryptosporangiaceae bacterium]|nr:formamidopyrimidine-DNA glycosylase [Cryptosporangiaceae bacterium]